MAPTLRTITGTIRDQELTPIAGVTVVARLNRVVHVPETIIPIQSTATSDSAGQWELEVWADDSYAVGYSVKYFKDGSQIDAKYVSIPAGVTAIGVGELGASESISDQDAAIAVLENYVDQKISAAVLGQGATASTIAITPTGDIEAATLQAAIAELDTEKLSTGYELPIDPTLLFENALL